MTFPIKEEFRLTITFKKINISYNIEKCTLMHPI